MLRERPILVAGLPRSGTSLVAGALGACGAFLGHTVPGGRSNPKGFFENVYLREHVDKVILRDLGCDPLGVNDLPDLDSLPDIEGLSDKVHRALASEGYDGSRPWLFKDAKLTLLWPIWQRAFPDARWIIVRRDTDQVVQSCLRTHFMVHHSDDPAFWFAFADDYLQRLERLRTSGAWCRDIWPRDLIAGDRAPLNALADELELTFDDRAVRLFVRPRYWHG